MSAEPRQLILVVLNWNGRAVLPACLSSLEEAACHSRHRSSFILVDNGSTDGSAEWAASVHPAWTLLATGANRGYAAGINAGLNRALVADPDFVCVLNNDIEAEPGFLDPLVADLEAEARRGAASPRIHYQDRPDRLWFGGGSVGRLTLVSRHKGIRRHAEGRWLIAADSDYLTGCCILGRAQFWKTTRGFDESFPLYGEDVDLSLRARALGWTLRYVPDALLYHRVGFASGGGLGPDKLRSQRRAVRLLLARHVRPALRPLAYAGWGLYLTRALLGALVRRETGLCRSLLRSLRPGGQGGTP